MKLKKIGLSLVFFSISISVFAGHNLKSSVITLPGGTIQPNGRLTLAQDKLLDNVSYDIVCKINDPNNKNNNVYLKIDGYWGQCNLNGTPASSQIKLNKVDNILQMTYLNNFNPISIINLDQDDCVTVVSCTATPSVSR